jgi:hypothetical protein
MSSLKKETINNKFCFCFSVLFLNFGETSVHTVQENVHYNTEKELRKISISNIKYEKEDTVVSDCFDIELLTIIIAWTKISDVDSKLYMQFCTII